MADDLRTRLVTEFISIAARFNAEGWVEYSLWETIEGKRDRPFKLGDPLSEEEMDILRLLRDVEKVWIYWEGGRWSQIDIDTWRHHAEGNTSDDVLQRLHEQSMLR